ncbi:sugar phosphate isomerase/epimerase family protein [Agaribacter marinus]|uniref:Sugar phosphate isomerase n=1 Tax=Agaribacter marinus TaxID=1431249 RepID=A0AA37WJA9_9ALTE|nr:sugar phosphate isomerase/epimerase [Agaribacter marinus]GLR71882.1 sugar phosphate isomerase [Agaribacter marinus]
MKVVKRFTLVCFYSVFCMGFFINLANAAEENTGVLSHPKISVQLWSVRKDVEADFKGTLTRLANMGFDAVEFAGNFGPYENDAKGLRKFLDELGLEVSGAHVKFGLLKNSNAHELMQFLSDIGTPIAIIPGDGRSANPEKLAEFTAELALYAKKLAEYGIKIGYHNHAYEFEDYKVLDGKMATFWEYVTANTPKNVVMQMDIGWVNYAGKDPNAIIKRYPNRTLTSHIKIRTKGNTGIDTIIGDDNFDWVALISDMRKHGGTEWLVVEQEEYPKGYTSLTAVEASKIGLEKALKKSLNKHP